MVQQMQQMNQTLLTMQQQQDQTSQQMLQLLNRISNKLDEPKRKFVDDDEAKVDDDHDRKRKKPHVDVDAKVDDKQNKIPIWTILEEGMHLPDPLEGKTARERRSLMSGAKCSICGLVMKSKELSRLFPCHRVHKICVWQHVMNGIYACSGVVTLENGDKVMCDREMKRQQVVRLFAAYRKPMVTVKKEKNVAEEKEAEEESNEAEEDSNENQEETTTSGELVDRALQMMLTNK